MSGGAPRLSEPFILTLVAMFILIIMGVLVSSEYTDSMATAAAQCADKQLAELEAYKQIADARIALKLSDDELRQTVCSIVLLPWIVKQPPRPFDYTCFWLLAYRQTAYNGKNNYTKGFVCRQWCTDRSIDPLVFYDSLLIIIKHMQELPPPAVFNIADYCPHKKIDVGSDCLSYLTYTPFHPTVWNWCGPVNMCYNNGT